MRPWNGPPETAKIAFFRAFWHAKGTQCIISNWSWSHLHDKRQSTSCTLSSFPFVTLMTWNGFEWLRDKYIKFAFISKPKLEYYEPWPTFFGHQRALVSSDKKMCIAHCWLHSKWKNVIKSSGRGMTCLGEYFF